MTWEATVSIIAVIVSVGTLLFSYLTWKTERTDREDAVAAERAARLAEQTDVIPVVTLVHDPRETGARYWRLRLSGGNAFSRVYLTSMEWHPGTRLRELHEDGPPARVLGGGRGLWMLAGQTSHIRFDPTPFGGMPDEVVVMIEWCADFREGVVTNPITRWMAIAVEPWG